MIETEKSIREDSSLLVTLAGGGKVDLNLKFKWENPMMTKKQKILIFMYSCLSKEDLKRGACYCSKLAGYGKGFYQSKVYRFLKEPRVLSEIENIKKQNENSCRRIKIKLKDFSGSRKRKKSVSFPLYVEIRKGEVVDINEFTWNPIISEKQRKFIFLVSFFDAQTLKGNVAKIARLAGYSAKSANTIEYNFFKDPIFLSELSKIKLQNPYKKDADIEFLLRKRSLNEPFPIFLRVPTTGKIVNINQKAFNFYKRCTEKERRFIVLCASVKEEEVKEKAAFFAIEAGYSSEGIKVRSKKLLEREDIAFFIKKIRDQYFLGKNKNLINNKGGEND